MANALGGGRRGVGEEAGLKRLRPQRSEVADEMEVERRNKKISGGREGGGGPAKGLWMRFRHVGAN